MRSGWSLGLSFSNEWFLFLVEIESAHSIAHCGTNKHILFQQSFLGYKTKHIIRVKFGTFRFLFYLSVMHIVDLEGLNSPETRKTFVMENVKQH